MSRVTIDVFHVAVRVPPDLPDSDLAAMARVLGRRRIRRRLARLVGRLLRRSPALATATVRVSR